MESSIHLSQLLILHFCLGKVIRYKNSYTPFEILKASPLPSYIRKQKASVPTAAHMTGLWMMTRKEIFGRQITDTGGTQRHDDVFNVILHCLLKL